jgi:phosphate transport system substrate-binding protein
MSTSPLVCLGLEVGSRSSAGGRRTSAARAEVKALADFCLDPENANLIMHVGYVPLPTLTLRSAQSRFTKNMTGSMFGGTGSVLGVSQAGLDE